MFSPEKRLALIFFFCMGACLMLLVACESRPKEEDPKASLTKAAEEYWTKRLIDFDYKFTYNMELEKDSLPFPKYLEKIKNYGQIKVLSLKAEEVRIDNNEGFVKITAKCRVAPVPKVVGLSLRDVWLYKSNQWKHKLPKK